MGQIKIYSNLSTGKISFDGAKLGQKDIGSIEAIVHPSESNRVIVKSNVLFKSGSTTEHRVFFKRLKISRVQNEAGETLVNAPYFYDRDQILSYLNNEFARPTIGEYFEYNPTTDRLKAVKAIETTLSSLHLGGQHRMSSGAANVYFDDLTRETSDFPVFGRLLDQSLPENQAAGAGLVNPAARLFGDFGSVGLGGTPVNDTAIAYDGDNFFSFNISGVGITTRVAEAVPASQRLLYELSVDGTLVYQQHLDHSGLSVNEDLTWYFTHPLDIEAGSTNHASITKVETIGNQETRQGLLLVCEGDDVNTRYQTNVLHRLFEDKEIATKDDVNALSTGSIYKGTYNADSDSPSLPTGSDVLGDFYRVATPGNGKAVGDVMVFNGTDYDHIAAGSVTQNDINSSGLRVYDVMVKAGYVGGVSDGSALYPFGDVVTAVASANDGDTIFLDGVFNVTSAVVLPADKSLTFVGSDGSAIQYASYDASNGNVLEVTGTDNSKEYAFRNLRFSNAGGYGILTKKTAKVEIENCDFTNNGWNGSALNTILPESTTALLGYDSSSADLQAFYAGSNASDGGALRVEESTGVRVIGNNVSKNLRGIKLQDCGIGGYGFVTRNVSSQNIESGIYLAAGTLQGCHNVTVSMNASSYNANTGLLVIGGINNKFSQNEVNGNWKAGFHAWGAANTTLRDCGLYDNNRAQFNGIGNSGDAKASIQINEQASYLGTAISVNPDFRFIAEILDTQVHYTGLGSDSEKVGLFIDATVGQLADNDKNIIKVDDVGFIGQDYAIDLSEVDVTNLRLSLGDNSYQSIGTKAINPPLAGNYSELPFSNHVMQVPVVDVVVDTLKQSITLNEGVGGNAINVYGMNELQSVLKTNSVDIIQRSSDRIQLRDCTLGNVYINGVVAGSNVNTMNDSLNSAFNMDLTEYKEFIETEVGAADSAAFYYVESPDGTYHYPLFKTEDEANQVDTDLSGSGTSHTHTYTDDLTNTTWYMPDVSNHMNSSVMPVNGLYTAPNGEEIESVVWNIQTTDDDANYLPTFSNITYNVQEGSAINIQYKAAGMTDTFNVTNVPTGYADNGFAIIGTAEDITNGAGNSIQHVINVTKANAFGSVSGTITINVLADLAGNEFTIVEQASGIKFTQDGGGTTLDFNTVTFNAGSTYKFYLDHGSVESNDTLMVVDANGNAYTTGVTLNGTVGSAGAYLEFVVPADVPPVSLVWTDGDGAATVTVPMTLAGSTYSANPTGIDLEGPSANQTGSNVMDAGDHGWISLDETLAAGERLVLDNAFFTDFFAEVKGGTTVFAIGLKGANWTNTKVISGNGSAASGLTFAGNTYIVGAFSSGSGSSVTLWPVANGIVGNSMLLNSTALMNTMCAFLEIANSQDNIRIGFGRNGYLINTGDESTVTYDNWNAYKGQSGTGYGSGHNNLDVMMSFRTYSGGAIDGDEIDWTGISEIAIPTPPSTNATNWTKAIDFSGGNEHLKQVSSSTSSNPLRMNGLSQLAGENSDSSKTSNDTYSRPWATAIVFQTPNDTSNQHIWNSGEGTGTNADNMYLRITGSNGSLYFGWGREGVGYNEYLIANIGGSYNQSTGQWWGIYIAHKGQRFNSSNATAANLVDAFDIRLMGTNDTTAFGESYDMGSTASNWTSTGVRMDRTVEGDFTIGGRGSNRSFHGKVASMVVTTLRRNQTMPTEAEIELMITDPVKWEEDYKEGQSARYGYNGNNFSYSSSNSNSMYATQIWLMGDGTSDSYANGVRNQVSPSDQNYTKLQINNMQSNDIQNVTISGLS